METARSMHHCGFQGPALVIGLMPATACFTKAGFRARIHDPGAVRPSAAQPVPALDDHARTCAELRAAPQHAIVERADAPRRRYMSER